jgi:hypothetical protein
MNAMRRSSINDTLRWIVTAFALILALGPAGLEGHRPAAAGGLSSQIALDPAVIPRCAPIALVSTSAARATDPSNNQAIQFAVPSSPANRPFVGQRVCLSRGKARATSGAAATQNVNVASFVGWPAQAHKKDSVSVGHMESWVKLSPGVPNADPGRIDGTTRIWTNNNAQGFTGGVKVQLQDRNGSVLQWDMPVQKYGVNANNPVSQAGAPSDRKVDWYFQVPASVLSYVSRVRIIHRHTPEGRWDQSIEMAKELGDVLKTYAEVYTTVAGAGGGAPTATGGTSGPTQPTTR